MIEVVRGAYGADFEDGDTFGHQRGLVSHDLGGNFYCSL